MTAQQCDKCGKFHRLTPRFGRHPEGIDPHYCDRCKVTITDATRETEETE